MTELLNTVAVMIAIPTTVFFIVLGACYAVKIADPFNERRK